MKTRRRKGTSNTLEYFITHYKDGPEVTEWLTVYEIALWDVCTIGATALRVRFTKIGKEFKDAWDCISRPQDRRGGYKTKPKPVFVPAADDFDQWAHMHRTM